MQIDIKMIKNIQDTLIHFLKHYTPIKYPGMIVHLNVPTMSLNESKMINHIIFTSNLRPKLYLEKKTGSYTPIEGIVIPKNYDIYSSVISKKSNFSRTKKGLIDKNILAEIEEGFILNPRYFPFKNDGTMAYLRKFITSPLPPIE